MLCFRAKRFRWKTHSKTLPEALDRDIEREVAEAVVIFFHAETCDADERRRAAVLRQSIKHIKWLANKRDTKNIVLHSFTHLGGETAAPAVAEALMEGVAARLRGAGYAVWISPFGYSCEWDLHVYGDALAKVWKSIP